MTGIFKVLSPDEIGPELMRVILQLGVESGMWQAPDVEYFETRLRNPSNINVVYFVDGKVLGHILARPHNDAVQDYCEEDPLMKVSDTPMYYVEHLVVDRAVRGRSLSTVLILKLIDEAKKRGVYRFSNHCRAINGLSDIVARKFNENLQVIRRIDSYCDCNNEPLRLSGD
jgi:GNAT superfamily N-acetyltransferase